MNNIEMRSDSMQGINGSLISKFFTNKYMITGSFQPPVTTASASGSYYSTSTPMKELKKIAHLCPDCNCILGKLPEMFSSCPQCGSSFSFQKPVEKWIAYGNEVADFPIRLLNDDEIDYELKHSSFVDMQLNKTCISSVNPQNPDTTVIKQCASELKANIPEHVNEAAYTKCCNDLAKSVTSLLQVPPILAALDEYKRTVGKEMALMQLELLTAKLKTDTLEREKKKLESELDGMTLRKRELQTKIDRALFSLS